MEGIKRTGRSRIQPNPFFIIKELRIGKARDSCIHHKKTESWFNLLELTLQFTLWQGKES